MAPEEARVLEMLFEDGPAILINPAKGEELNKYLLAIDGHLRKLNGAYFTRNARYIVLGILASLATAWWFFFCGMGLGAIVLVNVIPAWMRVLHGLGGARYLRVATCLLGVVGSLFAVLLKMLAKNISPTYSLVLAVLVVMNLAWAPALKRLTQRGRQALDEIEGFRVFLQKVEQDRMQRLNAANEAPKAMM